MHLLYKLIIQINIMSCREIAECQHYILKYIEDAADIKGKYIFKISNNNIQCIFCRNHNIFSNIYFLLFILTNSLKYDFYNNLKLYTQIPTPRKYMGEHIVTRVDILNPLDCKENNEGCDLEYVNLRIVNQYGEYVLNLPGQLNFSESIPIEDLEHTLLFVHEKDGDDSAW